MKPLQRNLLIAAPLVAAGIAGLGFWAEGRERSRFDAAEMECLQENYCKR